MNLQLKKLNSTLCIIYNVLMYSSFRVESTVMKYVEEVNPDSQLLLGTDMRKIQLAYSILKVRV